MKEWICGRNAVYEVLRSGRRQPFRLLVASGVDEKGRITDIIQLAEKRHLRAERAVRMQMDNLMSSEGNTTESHQGVMLQVSGYSYSYLDDMMALAHKRQEPLLLLALDMIQNPQNLGSLLRTAEAVGVHGVLLPLARAAGVTPAVVHASVGATEHLLVGQMNLAQAIAALKEANVWVVGLEGGPESRLASEVRLDGDLMLVVGNEGDGMRPLVARSCDVLMRLPMRGYIELLNAAVAGSIALYMALAARPK